MQLNELSWIVKPKSRWRTETWVVRARKEQANGQRNASALSVHVLFYTPYVMGFQFVFMLVFSLFSVCRIFYFKPVDELTLSHIS